MSQWNMIAKFEQKWLVCLVYGCITGTNGWNATKCTYTALEKDKEFIMFDDMHNISRSQQVMIQNCHHGMVWVLVGRGGSVFSQKTDVFPLLY